MKASLDGQPLAVTGFQTSSTARPSLSVVLVVDVSGSMLGDPITQARKALTEFVGSLEPGDQVALFAFDTNVSLLQDYTPDKTVATAAVARLTPRGDTALYDAVIAGAGKAAQATTDRKLMILLTDGVATVGIDKRSGIAGRGQECGRECGGHRPRHRPRPGLPGRARKRERRALPGSADPGHPEADLR